MTVDTFRHLEDPADPGTVAWRQRRRDEYRAWRQQCQAPRHLVELVDRLVSRDRYGVPTARRGRLFHTWQRAGEAYPVLAVREGAATRVVLRAPPAEDGSPGRIGAWVPSTDGRLVAYQWCRDGAEVGPVALLDVDAGVTAPYRLPDVRQPTLAWDGDGLFVPRADGLWYHVGGQPGLVPAWRPDHTPTGSFFVPVVSPDRRRLAVVVRHGADPRNALWLLRLEGAGRCVDPVRLLPAGVAVAHPRFGPDGTLYLATTWGAGRGRVVEVDPSRTEPSRWNTILPESEAVVRSVAASTAGVVVVRNGAEGGGLLVIPPGGAPVAVPVTPGGGINALTVDPDHPRAWIDYSNPFTPPVVLEIDLASAGTPAVQPWAGQTEIIETLDITTSRLTLRTPDGAEIGATLLRRGDNVGPTILSGYGGFGAVRTSRFRPEMLAWLLSGGHYCTAIVRGDGNLGADLHAAGRGNTKWRSVEDLVSVARHLIDTGVTDPGRLGLLGFSAGGLLAAGAAIHFGQLFAACVCVNPVSDLLRFPHLVGGVSWTAELGDPDDAADHVALERLSPYHAIRPGQMYPDFLICLNSADDRVDPAHGRKLCAALLHADRVGEGQPAGRTWPRAALLREDQGGHAWMPQPSVVGAVVDLLAFLGERLGLPAPSRTA